MSIEKNRFSIQELSELLSASKSKKNRDLVFFSLLICSGITFEELVSLKIENVNLDKAVLEATQGGIRVVDYFFPNALDSFLESYIKSIEEHTTWLFPGDDLKNHIDAKFMSSYTKKEYGGKFTKFKNFRNTLISEFRKKEIITDNIINSFFHYKDVSRQSLSYDKAKYYYDRAFPLYNLVIGFII